MATLYPIGTAASLRPGGNYKLKWSQVIAVAKADVHCYAERAGCHISSVAGRVFSQPPQPQAVANAAFAHGAHAVYYMEVWEDDSAVNFGFGDIHFVYIGIYS